MYCEQKDTQRLNTLYKLASSTLPMKCSGFNSELNRQTYKIVKKQPPHFLFGPLINDTATHPDTVLTSMVYILNH